jgi:hypothetical protein
MREPQIFHRATHGRHVALGVIDGLARALRVLGTVPPPLGRIECQIVRQTAPIARTFTPPLILSTFRNSTGFVIADGTYAREGEPGERRPLGDGIYKLRVRGEYYRDSDEFDLAWPLPLQQHRIPLNQPNTADNIALLPGPAYPLPDVTTSRFQLGPTILRGSLYTASGDPLRDVVVEVLNLTPFLAPPELPPLAAADWPFLATATNARGDWALVLPSRRYYDAAPEITPGINPPALERTFAIRIHYSPTPFDVNEPNVELASDHGVRNTALRGQVVGPGGRPIAGAQISTTVSAATSVTRANGTWFLYFDLDQPDVNSVTVTATTPDGATLSASSVDVRNRATVFVPTFHFS